jgi:two-component system nitrogen regulation response regulator NtrX
MILILIVEDDEKIGANVLLQLRDAGYGAAWMRSAEEAEAWLSDPANPAPDLLLVDVRLPGITGVELLRRLAGDGEPPAAIVMSGEASMTETVAALRLGVHDFLDKPFTRERLLKSVANCLELASLKRQVRELRAHRDREILGESAEVKVLRATIATVAPTDARVVIRGESGTGKELVASALHRQSRRASGPFVKLNCAAIPPHLIEDELFGHARGAFTDAKNPKPGLFEQASGGTLFLDEIGDMDPAVQSRLLRVLEDGKVRRIGETSERSVDVRVIAATHRDLQEMARAGTFREDLFFRLSAVPIDVPPLRRRRDDVPLLFAAFLQQYSRANGRPPLGVDAAVPPLLRAYTWPGNVRELRNVAERLSVFGTDPITTEQLPSAILEPGEPRAETAMLRLADRADLIPLRQFREECEKEYIELVLQQTNWNVTKAAQLLDLQRTHLHQKMATLGIRRRE